MNETGEANAQPTEPNRSSKTNERRFLIGEGLIPEWERDRMAACNFCQNHPFRQEILVVGPRLTQCKLLWLTDATYTTSVLPVIGYH